MPQQRTEHSAVALAGQVYVAGGITADGQLPAELFIYLPRALGWDTQTRLEIREQGGLPLVSATAQGVFDLTRQGHLRLPAPAWRWCGLGAGDRVLLAAERTGSAREEVVNVPPHREPVWWYDDCVVVRWTALDQKATYCD